jgi:signal transduction histidine kinase
VKHKPTWEGHAPGENRRLAVLHDYRILDTEAEKSFDDLVLLAAHICEMPIALVSLVDADRQWFKAKIGVDVDSTPRAVSFCAHAILGKELFVVPDATQDPRFASNPVVTGEPYVRFYAGAPLVTTEGEALGTICVVDRTPHTLRPEQGAALMALARQVVSQMELRRAAAANALLCVKAERDARRAARQAAIAQKLAGEQCGLREAVAGMEQVLGVVGHELRTPLAALRAISEFLTTDGASGTPEAERFMHEISSEVDRMSNTVDNLLEAARLNSGRARWNWATFDIGDVIADAVESVRPLIDAGRVDLVVAAAEWMPPMTGDPDAVRRLLINLLSNAYKHTRYGRITIDCERLRDAAGEWAALRISDTGCGIAPEVSARLGEAFALNAGVVGSNHVRGTGLGLAICKGIAAAHGGELRIASVQGQGTTVTARLRTDLPAAASGDTVPAGESERMFPDTLAA